MTTRPKTMLHALKRLYGSFSKRRRLQFFMILAFMFVGALAELATIGTVLPFLALLADSERAQSYPFLQSFFSFFGWKDSSQILIPITVLFVTIAVSAATIRVALAWAGYKFVHRLGNDIGIDVYRRTLYQPYSFHVRRNTSEILAGINKVQDVIFGILAQLMQMLIAIVIATFIVGVLIAIDPLVACAAAVGFGAIYVAVSLATRDRLKTNSQVIAQAATTRIQTIQEGLGGIRDVLIDHTQPVYIDKFRAVDLDYQDAKATNAFFAASPRFIIEASGMVLIAVLALLLAAQEGGLISALPVLGAFALGAQRLLPLFQQIYAGWTSISGTRESLVDVVELLEQPMPEQVPASGEILGLPFTNSIELKKVSFRYGSDQPLVLRNIDLIIKKGSRIGFVGKTGSGKSTILDLIMGLLEPTEGHVLIDGQRLDPTTTWGWQARIAHVPQAIYLSDATIAENIAFGMDISEIDMNRVRGAARKAEIAEFIEGHPEGYKAFVGERGIRLSGGQRQRIGIARALYKNANVLVFDEATSALDNDTEAAVMEAIDGLGRDLTVLMIAHRLSTVAVCDQVIRLSEGQIAASGTYDEIIQTLAANDASIDFGISEKNAV